MHMYYTGYLRAGVLSAIFMCNALIATSAPAQEVEPRRLADRDQLTSQVDALLPQWTEIVLQPRSARDWASATSLESIAIALADPELAAAAKRAINGSTLVRTKGSVLRFDPDRGLLSYYNAARSADFRNEIEPLQSYDRTQELTLEVLRRVGIADAEMHKPIVDTQMTGGGAAGSERLATTMEMYRLVTVGRQVGDIPVLMSSARMAVNSRGEVQRLQIRWPAFSLDRSDRLAARDEVLARAVDELLDQQASADVKLNAVLGYEERSGLGKDGYLPVVLVTATDQPSPFMFSVPVVVPAGDDEP